MTSQFSPNNPGEPGAVEFFEAEAVPTVVVKALGHPVAEMRGLFDTAFSALFPALAELGLSPVGPPFSLHTRIPDETADMEVGIPVSAPMTEEVIRDGVVLSPSTLPGGPAARTSHFGSYDDLGTAWGSFMGTLATSGRQPMFPFWEVYMTEPTPDMDPADLQTDLFTLVTDADQ